MSLSTEQIALLQDAAKYGGWKLIDLPWHEQFGFAIDLPGDASDTWNPLIDHGDLYDLMAAGKVYPDWDDNEMLLRVEPDDFGEAWVSESFTPNNFTSQAWAVITVCAMAQRRKEK